MSGVTFAGTQNDGFQWDIRSGVYRDKYMEEVKALREKYGPFPDGDPGFQREMEELRKKYASNPAVGYKGISSASSTPVAEQPSVFMTKSTETRPTEISHKDHSQVEQSKQDKRDNKNILDFMN